MNKNISSKLNLNRKITLIILGLFLVLNIGRESFAITSIEEIKEIEKSKDIETLESKFSGEISLNSPSAILIGGNKGEVLFRKNASLMRSPASLTKMMTAILVTEKLNLNKYVTVPREAVGIEGNNMKLAAGERIKAGDLLKAMLVYSANDAAVALAIETYGSVDAFVKKMNERAVAMGCVNTHFINPNGLTNSSRHYSTAADMAMIASEAMKKTVVRETVKLKKLNIPATNKTAVRKFKSTNLLLWKSSHCIGVKTGLMSSSGYCLTAAYKVGNSEFIAVTMGALRDGDRFKDCKTLLDFAITNYKYERLFKNNELLDSVRVKGGIRSYIRGKCPKNMDVLIPKSTDKAVLDTRIKINKNLKAPIKKGEAIGIIEIYDAGRKVDSMDVVAADCMEKGGPWSDYGVSDFMFYSGCIFLLVLFLLLSVVRIRKTKIRRKNRRVLAERLALEEARKKRREEYNKKRDWPF